MLIRPHDEAAPGQWRAILAEHDFGQFVFPGSGAAMPAIVPSHFVLAGEDRVLAHFTRDNPLWARVAESPRCALAVIAGYTYVPSAWNASRDEGTAYGVPTSYYAAVQLEGTCRPLDDPRETADLLNAMLAHFEPERARRRVEPGDNPDARQFHAIRGLEMRIERVRAKTKLGGNRSPEHRAKVKALLEARGGAQDVVAASFMRS
ncbi:MAG: transcriptional regulator [Thermoplasmata archaeon]|jgi:transcriptional regulator|nr:transcriptional regulator [Thermoplasmata archaeon]